MADRPAGDGTSPGERGSGTVLGLAVASVALVATLAVTGLGWSLQARATAQTAADLGALAGAQLLHAAEGSPAAACARARSVVLAGGAALDACQVTDGVVEVRATVVATRLLTATARARAGLAGR